MIFTRKLLPIWSPVSWAAGSVCIGHITLFVSILVILISVLCDIYQEVVANMESCWLGCWKGLLLGSLQHREDCDLLKTLAEDLAKKIAEEFDLHLGLDITEVTCSFSLHSSKRLV